MNWWIHTARRRAFSLVEILVVVAVILMLARLLMPALDKAKETAVAIQCANNLHQLGVAFQTYSADYLHYPGIGWKSGGANNQPTDWARFNGTAGQEGCSPRSSPNTSKWSALGAYANPSDRPCKSTVFYCPADPTASIVSYRGMIDMCNKSVDPPSDGACTNPIPTRALRAFSTNFLLIEQDAGSSDGGQRCSWDPDRDGIAKRHKGGTNVLFLDGRVGWALKGPDGSSKTGGAADNAYGLRNDWYNDRGCHSWPPNEPVYVK